MLQKSPNRFLFQQENRLNCFIFVAIQFLSHFRSKNNPFEQEHRCTKIGQVDCTE